MTTQKRKEQKFNKTKIFKNGTKGVKNKVTAKRQQASVV
jgi:hypothetical protein